MNLNPSKINFFQGIKNEQFKKIGKDLPYGLLAVHKTFGNNIRRENLVAMTKFLEGHSIGKALSAYANTLEYAVAT